MPKDNILENKKHERDFQTFQRYSNLLYARTSKNLQAYIYLRKGFPFFLPNIHVALNLMPNVSVLEYKKLLMDRQTNLVYSNLLCNVPNKTLNAHTHC